MNKIKKITVIEIIVALIVVLALGIYFCPKFLNSKELRIQAKVKAQNAIYTSKALEEFAVDKNAKASAVALKVMEELNAVEVSPFNKKEKAYTNEKNCTACNSIEIDDAASMIIITTYDKKGDLMARTVIKPPSFVTYNKMDDEKKD